MHEIVQELIVGHVRNFRKSERELVLLMEQLLLLHIIVRQDVFAIRPEMLIRAVLVQTLLALQKVLAVFCPAKRAPNLP